MKNYYKIFIGISIFCCRFCFLRLLVTFGGYISGRQKWNAFLSSRYEGKKKIHSFASPLSRRLVYSRCYATSFFLSEYFLRFASFFSCQESKNIKLSMLCFGKFLFVFFVQFHKLNHWLSMLNLRKKILVIFKNLMFNSVRLKSAPAEYFIQIGVIFLSHFPKSEQKNNSVLLDFRFCR